MHHIVLTLKQTYPGELVVQAKPKRRGGKRGCDDACPQPKLGGKGTNREQGLRLGEDLVL